MNSKHLRGYVLAASSCLSAACGGTFLDGGTAEIVGGIALIAASVHGPDPRFWQPISAPDGAGKSTR